MELKARLVTPGFADADNLEGKLKKDAPTLPSEAIGVILQCAASKRWTLSHGDVESAFLSGAYFQRELYVIVPRGGLPATASQPELPAGTIMKCKKSMPGLADAPLEWYKEQRRGHIDLGFAESAVAKSLYLYGREVDGVWQLEGLLGVHVDDDLITGSPWFYENVVPELRRRFKFGSWKERIFTHIGLEVVQDPDTFEVQVGQPSYAMTLKKVYLPMSRRQAMTSPATKDEITALRAGAGKLAWLHRNTRPDLGFGWSHLMQGINEATVETILFFNSMVTKAQKAAHMTMRYVHVPLDELQVIGWCDAPFANVTDGRKKDNDTPLASQAGYMIGFAKKSDVEEGGGRLSMCMWKTHKIKRKVRSTLAAECAAANECLEASDLLRSHIVELLDGKPLDRRKWRQEVRRVSKSLVTDSRSMFDFLNKRGSTPSDKRLRLDLEMIRDEIDDEGLRVKWVNTHQQLADALTKGSLDAAIYLMLVAKTAVFALKDDPRLIEQVADFKAQQRMLHTEVRERQRKTKQMMKELEKRQHAEAKKNADDTVFDEDGDAEMKDDMDTPEPKADVQMNVGDLCVALVQALCAATAVSGAVACVKTALSSTTVAEEVAEEAAQDEAESDAGSAGWEQVTAVTEMVNETPQPQQQPQRVTQDEP